MSTVKYVDIVPRGGCERAGGPNMTELTIGGGQSSLSLAIDAGVAFADQGDLPFGIARQLPNLTGLMPQTVIVTHGHLDHYGALLYMLGQNPDLTVYAPPFAEALIRAELEMAGIKAPNLHSLTNNQEIYWEEGAVTAHNLSVSHSVPDSKAVVLHTPAGTILHTGDWRGTPDAWGQETDWSSLRQLGQEGVLALLIDSTGASQRAYGPTEEVVQQSLTRIIQESRGAVWATFVASNIGRAQMIIDAALQAGRVVVQPLGASLQRTTDIATALKYLKLAPDYQVSLERALTLPPSQLLWLVAGSQYEPGSAMERLVAGTLTRTLAGRDKEIRLGEGDTIIFSASTIPGQAESRIPRALAELEERGVNVFHEDLGWPVHASGHPRGGDIERMITTLRPMVVIPIQADYPDRIAVAQLTRELGAKPWIIHPQQKIRLNPNGWIENLGKIPGDNLSLNSQGEVINPQTLGERRRLARGGLVIVSLPIDQRGQLFPPAIETIGVREETRAYLKNKVREAVLEALKREGKAALATTAAQEKSLAAAEQVLARLGLSAQVMVTLVKLELNTKG